MRNTTVADEDGGGLIHLGDEEVLEVLPEALAPVPEVTDDICALGLRKCIEAILHVDYY
jgi:hypothetical protein